MYDDGTTLADRLLAAYQAGRAARRLRKITPVCPFTEGTPAHDEWMRGYQREASRLDAVPA